MDFSQKIESFLMQLFAFKGNTIQACRSLRIAGRSSIPSVHIKQNASFCCGGSLDGEDDVVHQKEFVSQDFGMIS
jgi:hypothetical protein